MAWNGRNVSILGGNKSASDEAPASAAPSKNESSQDSTSKAAVEAQKAPAPAPSKPSVWGGRHQKIMSIRDPSAPSAAPAAAAAAARSPSLAEASAMSNASSSKKEQLLVVSSSPKDIKSPVPMAKEDETTNSTAGSSRSSITNTTIEDQGSVEVKVVTTVSTDDKQVTNDAKKDTTAARNNNSTRQPRNASNGGANNAGRRVGNNNKGARNNNQGTNRQTNFSRGNSGGANARRRAANNNTGTFKQDPAYAPQRSGTHPPSSGTRKPSAPFRPAKRAFDPHKARAIQLAKEAQNQEDRTKYASGVKIIQDADAEAGEEKKSEMVVAVEDPPFFSIDVECIATGYGSCAKGINDGCGNEGRSTEGVPAGQFNGGSHRYPGRIAMVDSEGALLADIVIRPPQDGKGVVSYLTPLTGLTSEMCLSSDAKSLEEAVEMIKELLPKNGVLVGQAIDHDVEWLGLVSGRDFERMVDICQIFRQRMPAVLAQAAGVVKAQEEGSAEQSTSEDKSSDEYLGFPTRYRHFSLRHVSLNLLGSDIQSGVHNPITDAQYSLLLFHKYRNVSVTQLRIVRDGLHRAPITPGFAQENTPVIDGVCVSAMGYHYKRAGRKILRWYTAKKQATSSS